jgi:competence protein ComEA
MRKMVKPLVRTLIVGLLPTLAWAGPVDINTADAETLAAELDGIGLARAQAIVEDRQANGPFVGAEDLGRVKGVGQWIVQQNRANIQVGTKR